MCGRVWANVGPRLSKCSRPVALGFPEHRPRRHGSTGRTSESHSRAYSARHVRDVRLILSPCFFFSQKHNIIEQSQEQANMPNMPG